MSIECPIEIGKLTTEEFRELDYVVMRHAFDSQNCLGRLADERIYQADLAQRLLSAGMHVKREIPIRLTHDSFCKSLFLDLVVAEQAVYELKAVRSITDEHVGQLLTYLYLLDLRRGKLINFRPDSVESRFTNAPLTLTERRVFAVESANYCGGPDFEDLVIGLLRDWGTSLTLSLYQEAIVALTGGPEIAEAMIPLERSGIPLGNQRFQMASNDTAFRLTAINHETVDYQYQLARLLALSPLRAIHWINIAHHHITLKTIAND